MSIWDQEPVDDMTAAADALVLWAFHYCDERSDCIRAGECVHDHVNGACPYSEGKS